MRNDQPSLTAALVAACRGLDALLPEEARLVHDPYGARFGGPAVERLAAFAARHSRLAQRARPLLPPLSRLVFWMQLRTRTLDDHLRAFVQAGGRQVLLLGAGFDCRAARLQPELDGTRVLEVDHPATQAKKREVLTRAGAPAPNVVYLAWDFERDPLDQLPARLTALGHDRDRPTFTLWEGVTMYLSEPAIDATVRAVRALSSPAGAPGSRFAFTWFDRRMLERPHWQQRLAARLVARAGEPWRFGWDPAALPDWLAQRAFRLVRDQTEGQMAEALFPPRLARRVRRSGRHIALAEPI